MFPLVKTILRTLVQKKKSDYKTSTRVLVEIRLVFWYFFASLMKTLSLLIRIITFEYK